MSAGDGGVDVSGGGGREVVGECVDHLSLSFLFFLYQSPPKTAMCVAMATYVRCAPNCPFRFGDVEKGSDGLLLLLLLNYLH